MSRRRCASISAALAVRAMFAALLLASLASCSSPRESFIAGNAHNKEELRELFSLLDSPGADAVQRFAALRQISDRLLALREYGRLTSLLVGVAGESPRKSQTSPSAAEQADVGARPGAWSGDPFAAWYLFTAAYAYEQEGAAPIAALYYDRIVKNWPDLIVDGRSVHFECLSRLIETVQAPERRIGYYKDLIERFPERVDMGRMLFLLGKEYEHVGDWDLAVKTYSRFLPYFGSSIPGYPDALQYAQNIVQFYNSPKDWAYEDLQILVSKVKAALTSGDPYRLKGFRAKVGFFAVSWHQDETEVNSQALFDFSEFMSGGRIMFDDNLDPGSGPREAYLKTWGWSERITTWYLYFRKIYFPADPEIHGQWEWAGVYFGEKMQ